MDAMTSPHAPLPLPELRLIEAARLPLEVAPFALVTALEGDVIAALDDERFRLRSGELLVLRADTRLRLERPSPAACVALFHAAPAWVAAFRALHGLPPLSEPRPLDLVPAGTTLARRAAQHFAGHRLGESASGAEPVPAATTAALLQAMDEAAGSPLDPRCGRARGGSSRSVLVRALADYDPEAGDDFSLQHLAARIGLSERHTARLVLAETGRSFRELKAERRLEHARKLLASTELPILEVALRAGWTSASQFHEAFRSRIGISPGRFRAAHRAA